ncbi:DNA repair protein RAD50 [Cladophialophora psammophila CBS 110553]|uniref:DNA repair protein RAD50 n=1 Tax=Cladophialophora psammophila CBS 110553 TaxID=1182543 RepID=W9WJQ0_9EURO|nr:DNA repair protein RAD50 [Cladophialophora psammophila CBS 110553]EXJ68332.1 DNA repair protein RAD50 [Cladophialophora psammophila CBS 110553]
MSRLHVLKISGIRSFDNNQEQHIKFETPLTLIVGQNGSGKTTIIECLKFAFTGMQPPNTKVGGAFVHDPKLNSDSQVKAQVQVSFKSASGAALTVSRRLELNVKKTTRSLKTLECSLVVSRRGERTVVSSRVAELDLILPQYLGVSTAIIDNVIFCHQDESFWPLSDPTTLKKKFDEIFEAQKYTKAIENIKQIRKKHNEELGKYKILEDHAKLDKARALKAQKRKEALSDEIEKLRKKSEELQQRIDHARRMADETWRKGEEYAKILGALEGKRIEAQGKQATIDDLKLHLVEVSEPDEWLQTTLSQFQARQEELRDELSNKQEAYIGQQDQMKLLGKQREEKVKLKGKYEQEKEAHERHLERRKEMVRDAAAKHQIRGYEDLEDDNQVEEFLVKIKKMSKHQKEDLDQARLAHTTQRRDAQTLINKLTERKLALQDQRATARKQMDSNDREAGEFQNRVNQITVDEGSKAVAESRIDDLNKELQKTRQAAEAADWDKKIQNANAELRAFEEISSKLRDEMFWSTKKAEELAKLSIVKQELKDRQKRLETLLNAHSDRITALLGHGAWSADKVENAHQEVLRNATSEVSASERERDSVNRELEQLQFKQKTVRKDLSRKENEAKKCEQQLRAVIEDGPQGYDEALKQAEENVREARENSSGFSGLHDYYQQVLDACSGDKPACRTCMRGFTLGSKTLADFQERINKLIAKTKAHAEQSDPEAAEAEYKRMLDLGVVHRTWKKLVDSEIPTVAQETADLDVQRQSLLTNLEKHDKSVVQKQQVKRDIESIGQTVSSISKCDSEIRSLSGQVKELSAKQSQQSNTRTLEEIQEELNSTDQKVRGTQNVINRLRTEQEQSRAGISGMELELRDLKGNLNNVIFQLEKKVSLAARVEEFRTNNQKQRELMENLTKAIEQLEPQIATARAKYDDVDQRAATKEREMSDGLSNLNDTVNNLDILNDQIQSYVDRDGPNQLGHVNRELKNLEQELDDLQSEQNQLTREINQTNERIRDGESTRRKYSDNLRYRQESRALARLREEIKELESHNAEADRDRFQQESQKYSMEYNRLGTQQGGLLGEVKSKDNQLSEILEDYKTDLKDAPQRYKEAHIKVEATKAAVEDLARYGGALDKAIMKYHSLKMEEINSIIEELWRKTYRGTDVDTIMIRAENESGRGNRSYNYRVVMVKRGAEMDMRGRCSAGQKVLASIIIRLALAEVFSTHCGLIALDEPTTNLDRDNIESLAQSLKEIIEYRQQQSNFQLVVITHDEDFLRQMECSKFTGTYYRVSRDSAQNSIIERQSIAEVL